MKILQTIKYYEPSKGGMETVAKNLVNGLLAADDTAEIKILCNNHINTKQNTIEKIGRLVIMRQKLPFAIKSQPVLPLYSQLGSEIKDADVIHHHYPFPTMEMALLRHKKLLRNKTFVVTWHANIKNSRWAWIKDFYNPLIKKLLTAADCIAVTSPQLFEFSDILKDFEKKVTVVPLSYDSNQKQCVTKTFLHPIPEILYVGKLRKYKGIETLLEAVKPLNIKLKIVGNGEQEMFLKSFAEKIGVKHKVEFFNNVSDEELPMYYQNADFFVLPSVNEAEAFGVVQLEALSYGLPVINTYLQSGVPFVSLDSITGFTVAPGNVLQLRAAICRIIEDQSLYATFSKNAIQRAKEFTNNKMVEKYLRIYKV